MNDYTHIDLFSGIGGFALAAQWAGFKTICFSEIDPYASAVLRKHWPEVPNLGDITKADFSPYAGATLLTGGFPCQPWSNSGLKRGVNDDRHLWPAMLEAVKSTRPAWVVGENVAGIERERVWILASSNQIHGGARVGNCQEAALQPWPRATSEDVWINAACEAVGVADGIPQGPYSCRVGAIGNAIVPQVAFEILRGIAQIEGMK